VSSGRAAPDLDAESVSGRFIAGFGDEIATAIRRVNAIAKLARTR
jgi:hypothetical protein